MSRQPEDKPIELWRDLSTAQLMAAVCRTFSIPSTIVVSLWTSPEQGEDKRWDLTDQRALNEILEFGDELYVGVEVAETLEAREWLMRRAGYVKVEIRREGKAPVAIAAKKYASYGELRGQIRARLDVPDNQQLEMVWRDRRWDEREDWNVDPDEEDDLTQKLIRGGPDMDLVVIVKRKDKYMKDEV